MQASHQVAQKLIRITFDLSVETGVISPVILEREKSGRICPTSISVIPSASRGGPAPLLIMRSPAAMNREILRTGKRTFQNIRCQAEGDDVAILDHHTLQ